MKSKRSKDYKISEETKKLTKKCHCDFCCLEGGDICSVFMKLKESLLIKEPVTEAKCQQQTKLGNKSLYCKCPIRYQIYLKYGV
jgi:hypothetical protein